MDVTLNLEKVDRGNGESTRFKASQHSALVFLGNCAHSLCPVIGMASIVLFTEKRGLQEKKNANFLFAFLV